MEHIPIFSVPIFKFNFNEHLEYKDKFVSYFNIKENTDKNSRPKFKTKFTGPDLHKTELFNPLFTFFKQSLEQSMITLGYRPDYVITSMWGTEHLEFGGHHRHPHSNSFLSGVYYLNGSESHSGTIFHSPYKYQQITPAQLSKKLIKSECVTEFQEGTLYIFPSWLEHSTRINYLKESRHIIAFNSMPVGKTNVDEYDRYYYSDISDEEFNNDMVDHQSFSNNNNSNTNL
jgi:uncharacterized protein (TIGR02466 family)